MQSKLSLQLLFIALIVFVSFAGFAFPFVVRGQERVNIHTPLFSIIKCFAIGIILGVSLMHLLVDALEFLEDICEFPRKFAH